MEDNIKTDQVPVVGDDASVQLVIYRLNDQEYASPISDIQEIVKVPDVTVPLPGSPPYVLGMMNLRSEVVALIDLESFFSKKQVALDALQKEQVSEENPLHVLILQRDNVTFGIVIDEAMEVIKVPESKIKKNPGLTDFKVQADYVQATIVLDEAYLATNASVEEEELWEDEVVIDKNGEEVEKIAQKTRLIVMFDLPKLLSQEEFLKFSGNIRQREKHEVDSPQIAPAV